MFDYEVDNTTLVILLAIVATLLYDRISKPSPLVHPLLLGRQAEVSAVRKEHESGVYRSFATGHGTPFIIRPANTLKTVHDVVQPVDERSKPVQRCILDVPLTDEGLGELQRLLPLGIRALFPFKSPEHQTCRPILVLLPPTPSCSLPLFLLSLVSSPSNPLIILPSPQLLITALSGDSESHPQPGLVVTHESIAEDVIEQVAEVTNGNCGVLVAGDTVRRLESLGNKSAGHGVDVRFWEDLWDAAENFDRPDISKPIPSDVHSYFYSSEGGEVQVTSFTHQNFTAGIAGLLSLFPADKRPSAPRKDIVASAIPLTQPIGLTIAMGSVWSGAGFRLFGPSGATWVSSTSAEDELDDFIANSESDKPTVIFGTSKYHAVITKALQKQYSLSPAAQFVVGSKQSALQAGFISRSTLWDKLIWRSLRASVFNGLVSDRVRALVVVGETPSGGQLGLSNLLLSMPTSRISVSPYSAGPITVSHFTDIQGPLVDLGVAYDRQYGSPAHSGAPAHNLELVLRGVENLKVSQESSLASDTGAAPPLKGTLWARGPALGEQKQAASDGWVMVASNVQIRTNGTFLFEQEFS